VGITKCIFGITITELKLQQAEQQIHNRLCNEYRLHKKIESLKQINTFYFLLIFSALCCA